MRASLENIEFIETYLVGSLNPAQLAEMEQTISNSNELTELLEFQKILILATERTALKKEIESYIGDNGKSFFRRFNALLLGGLLFLGIIVIITTIFSQKSNNKSDSKMESVNELQTDNTRSFVPTAAEQSTINTVPIYQRSQRTTLADADELSPWIPFRKQFFDLRAEEGGVLQGEDGTLVVVPKNALLDKNNRRIKGLVSAELIEAIDWEDMIAYNLVTMNGQKALSSGGMLRIQFEQNGEKLTIDPSRPLHIEVPTTDYNPEMMAWEGVAEKGKLDWQNPIPLKKFLTEIPLSLLDFLPDGFKDEVATLLPYKNHTSLSSALVDSLYYAISINSKDEDTKSFPKNDFNNSCYFKVQKRSTINGKPNDQLNPYLKGKGTVTGKIVDEKGLPISGMKIKLYMDDFLENEEIVTTNDEGIFTYDRLYAGKVTLNASLSSSGFASTDWKYCAVHEFEYPKRTKRIELETPIVADYSSQFRNVSSITARKTGGCFIDPLSIKTLKTDEFQHSFIATKEFEERLKAMHASKNGSILLDVYLKNLTKELWQCDQLASQLLSGKEKVQFEAFALERLTTVENQDIYQDQITNYYAEKRKEYKSQQLSLEKEYTSKSKEEIAQLLEKLNALQKDEIALATQVAERKGRTNNIVKSKSSSPLRPSSNSRNVATNSSYKVSWFSTSWINIDCYLSKLGSTPWTASITTNRNSNNLTVYQCIRELKTLVGLSRIDDKYIAKFPQGGNQLETYCLAIEKSDNQIYFDAQHYLPTSNAEVSLQMRPISDDSLYTAICSLSPAASRLAGEIQETKARLAIELRIKEQQGKIQSELRAIVDAISKENTRYNQLYDVINKCPLEESTDTQPGTVREVPIKIRNQ